MPRKDEEPARTGEGGASTSKKRKTSSQSNSDREDLSRILHKSLLPRGYPIPSQFAGCLHNTYEARFGELDGYNEEHTSIKLLALSISQSVVSLASFEGRIRHVTCTGTIIEDKRSSMSILTSASLIRSSEDGQEIPNKLKIKVRLPNGKLVVGKLWNYDSYYNIAVVNIKAFPELRVVPIHNEVAANVSQNKLVAVGRAFESGELMATGGTLLYGTSKLDCQQLMASTCKTTKAGIGGPLIGSDGNFIGISFYYKDGAPFLPISILLKCLKHFSTLGRIVQPRLGLRIGSLEAEKLRVREKVHDSFPNAHGIYVQKVSNESPAEDSGIKVGDVITKLDGSALCNAQKFHELILDKTESTLEPNKHILSFKFPDLILDKTESTSQLIKHISFKISVLRPSTGAELCTTINAVIDKKEQNSWPVPKTKWLYPGDIPADV